MEVLQQYYINSEDKYEIPAVGVPLTNLTPGMLEKINGAKALLKSSYNIPVKKYQTVITTSDIHADLLAISRILFNAGLTTAEVTPGMDNVFTIRWNEEKKNTILILVGDIVDGNRGGNSVPDATGDIEILLHIFLFNLRISARQYDSELRFLIGNHDYHTVIQESQLNAETLRKNPQPYETADPHILNTTYYGIINIIYDRYVHPTAKTLFGERANRRNCLLPFYEACPYITVTIGNEAIFVHASLHGGNDGDYNMTEKLLELQGKIDELGLNDTICRLNADNTEDIKFISNVNDPNPKYGGPLWSRYYSYSPRANVCKVIDKSPYKMTIVGHCQTNLCSEEPGGLAGTIIKKQEYASKQCKDGGCVLLGCGDESGPRLAFVDITMSSAFNKTGKRNEILLLEHNEPSANAASANAASVNVASVNVASANAASANAASANAASANAARYYNKIYRLNTGIKKDENDKLIIWEYSPDPPDPPESGCLGGVCSIMGGSKKRRHKTRRRQIKKKTRKYRKYL